jgi:hypothetical protein
MRQGIGASRSRATGTRYDGEWMADLYHGFGTLRGPDGIYTGQFVAGQRCGAGVQRAASGEVLHGCWAADRYSGAELPAAAAAVSFSQPPTCVLQGCGGKWEGGVDAVSAERKMTADSRCLVKRCSCTKAFCGTVVLLLLSGEGSLV